MTTEHAPPAPPPAPPTSDRPTPAERLAIALGTSQTVPAEPTAPTGPAVVPPEPLVAD
jgi:hypothetical protein